MRPHRVPARPATIARRAFTLLEMLVVVLVIGILAAVVVPRFAHATEDAKLSSLDSILASVRGSVAAYRTNAIIEGEPPFPTLSALTSVGEVMPGEIPANPYTGARGVREVTRAQAEARTVLPDDPAGWLYFADSASAPPVAIFYANSDAPTGLTDNDGQAVGVNER